MITLLHDFFQSLADFISNVWEFIKFVFDELIQFFRMIGAALSFAWSIIQFIPSIYIAFAFAMILVLLIYVIVGRNAGGD